MTWDFHPFYFNGNEGNANDVFFFDATTGIASGALFDFTGAIARTTDNGVDWNSTIFPQPLEGIDFPTSDAGWVVGLGGVILKSVDMGVSFSAQASGTFSDLFDVSFASDGWTGVAVGQSGTIVRTTNGGVVGGLDLVSAASEKGGFAIDLPLDGAPGIESRLASDNFLTLVFTFSAPVTSVAAIGEATCGRIGAIRIDPQDAHRVLASYLSNGCNGEVVACTIHDIAGSEGQTLSEATVTMGLLLGDVTADGVVDDADYQATKLNVGKITDNSNFREDLNADGRIDRNDARLVRRKSGSALLP